MQFDEMNNYENVSFGDISAREFLLGLLSAFDNRYQACADKMFREITWKQFFAIICIQICKESPTINELAEVMGSSHQNVKQILLKLERKGFITMVVDEKDRRKQRISLTQTCRDFCEKNEAGSKKAINDLYRGISAEQLATTIQTIIQMERNVRDYEDFSDLHIANRIYQAICRVAFGENEERYSDSG